VFESTLRRNKSSILILCEREDSKWSIVGIELDRKSKHFIHFNLGSYSTKEEAYNAYCIKKERLDDFLFSAENI
jgi:hypothetical protein